MALGDLERTLLSRLTMRHVRQISILGRLRSMSRASEVLHLSQPALSKALREVETMVGVKLFERTARGLVPTSGGSQLLQRCQAIEAELRRAGQDLQGHERGTTGRVAVGSFLVAMPELLPRAIAQLMASSGNLAIHVMDGSNKELVPALLAGDIDFIVGRVPEGGRSVRLNHEVLYHEPIVLVVGADHPLTRKRRLRFHDLEGLSWVLPAPESSVSNTIADLFIREGLASPARYVESISPILIPALLRQSNVIATMPRPVAAYNAALGLLKILPLQLPNAPFPVGITTVLERQTNPAAKRLIQCLRETAVSLARRTRVV